MPAHFRFTVAFCIGPNHQPLQSGYELYSATTGSPTAKRPFGGPEPAFRYLVAYTHRVAISNHRLVALENGNVTSAGAIPRTAQEEADDVARP